MPKSQFEVLTVYPNPEEAALETESQPASPSPSPTGSGQEEVVIIPAVPTPQVLDFPGRASNQPKE